VDSGSASAERGGRDTTEGLGDALIAGQDGDEESESGIEDLLRDRRSATVLASEVERRAETYSVSFSSFSLAELGVGPLVEP
jgi:hypothetical protein